jgi:hypothetical protein
MNRGEITVYDIEAALTAAKEGTSAEQNLKVDIYGVIADKVAIGDAGDFAIQLTSIIDGSKYIARRPEGLSGIDWYYKAGGILSEIEYLHSGQ